MSDQEKYVRSPEDEALMKRVAEEAALEDAERSKRFEMREQLNTQRQALEKQIEEIDRKMAELID